LRQKPLRLKPGTGEERAFEDRLLLRLPGFVRSLFAVVLRLPPWMPPRGPVLRRAVRQAFAALNRRDLDAVLARYDPSIEFFLDDGPDSFPDMGSHYEGVEGAREVVELFLDAWEDVRWEPRWIVDAGDRFVTLLEITGRGRSGVELREQLGVEYTVERGRVVRQTHHWGWEETLRLAGVEDD
jgi:ketosteroid isomerase-like protein